MQRRAFCLSSTGFTLLAPSLGAQPLSPPVLRPAVPGYLVGCFAECWLNRDPLEQTLNQSLSFLGKPSAQNNYPVAGLSHAQVIATLQAFREQLRLSASALEFEQRIWHYFDFFQATGQKGTGDVLFTGYYEPLFAGSLQPNERFRYPLYRLPPDLVIDKQGKALGRRTASGLIPSYTRKEIDEGSVLRGHELAWLDNLFDVYLIHVQGSARLSLEDGRTVGIGYAGKNEYPYQSLGKALISSGILQAEEVSLPILRRYFEANPDRLKPFLYINESYVFFRETPLDFGPKGSIGVPLTAMHSIATDRNLFPRGALALVDVQIPGEAGEQPWRRFVCNQDTGGAILGPGRVDLFIGSGSQAEAVAGKLKSTGSLYFPVLRADAEVFTG